MATRAYNYAKTIEDTLINYVSLIDTSYNYLLNNLSGAPLVDSSSATIVTATGNINPTLGTIYKNMTLSINYNGERLIKLSLGFSGGTDGSGEYIYRLPENIYFNITKNPIYTGTLWQPDVGSMINYLIPTKGSIVERDDWSIVNYIVPYSNNSYRIVSSSVSLSGFTTLSKLYFGHSKSILISLEFSIYI